MSRELVEAFFNVFKAVMEHKCARLNLTLSDELHDKIVEIAAELFMDDFCVEDEPSRSDEIGHARWRDQQHRALRNRSKADQWCEVVVESCLSVVITLPKTHPGSFSYDTPTTQKMVDRLTCYYVADQNPDFFKKLKKTLVREIDKKAEPIEVLKGTPLFQFFPIKGSIGIPDHIQFAHTWVLAGSGHGKTTLLTSLVHPRIQDVLKGHASVVLIDSQNAIIPALERLKVWHGTNRLIVIDPADPIAFSLFDPPKEQLNAALEMVQFVFAKLTDSEMTYRQRNMFDYLAEFLITAVPDATIHDFRNLLDPRRAPEYDQYKENASAEVRDYLETDFIKEKFTTEARQQVLTKMRAMLRQPAFAEMFGAPKTKLNLFRELERGVCILIKPDKYQLGDDGTRLFGRFWIAQLALVAQQRQNSLKKTPTFFYIDECQDYLRGGDPKIEGILEQARKQNMGLTILHHYADQLKSTELVQLLGANTATKMCGSLATSDLSRMASYLQCEPSFIVGQKPRRTFATFVRGLTPNAVSLHFPYVDLATEPRMSEAEYQHLRQLNRERYGTHKAPEGALRETRNAPPRGDDPPIIIPATTHRNVNTGEQRRTGPGKVEKNDPSIPDPDY